MPDDKERGLYRKYNVERVDGKPLKGGGALVLELGDPNARLAIEQYAETVRGAGYESLAEDILLALAQTGGK